MISPAVTAVNGVSPEPEVGYANLSPSSSDWRLDVYTWGRASHAHTQTQTDTRKHTHTHTHTHAHAHAHAHAHTNTRTRTDTHTHPHAHAHTHARAPSGRSGPSAVLLLRPSEPWPRALRMRSCLGQLDRNRELLLECYSLLPAGSPRRMMGATVRAGQGPLSTEGL
jgi:hypothetical protein